jgi:hypothetical protein
MQIAYYLNTVAAFAQDGENAILGTLTKQHSFALEHEQKGAWLSQIRLLQPALVGLNNGYILFEFSIPRMGKRADVVLIIGGIVFVLEFKVGAISFDRSAIEQVHDYALDLKNFHRGSHGVPIVPIVLATAAAPPLTSESNVSWAHDLVARPILADVANLQTLANRCLSSGSWPSILIEDWLNSGYEPTPTIVEAAQALFQDHDVREIARSDAGAHNLSTTTDCIATIIDRSKSNGRKSICFVTGVPGAGKTLAGLNIATKRAQEHSDEHAVFLSGNGPLVSVLREALARDEVKRKGTTKRAAERKVASFIQNIHHFRDEALNDTTPPYEKVVVFDEAQRAWSRKRASDYMQKKRGHTGFNMSEPEFLISVMDRHQDWCVIICLIGGGQEINTGEAGLAEWLQALEKCFQNWDIYISDRLEDTNYVSDDVTRCLLSKLPTTRRGALHLGVSMRSFRAEALSSFVDHIVGNSSDRALRIYAEIAERYPIWLTRDINECRRQLRCRPETWFPAPWLRGD